MATARATKTEKGFSSQEICAILEKSKQAGILHLKVEGLELSFAPAVAATPPRSPRQGVKSVSVPGVPAKDPTEEGANPQLLTPADFEAAGSIERAQTLIEDPLQFEQDQIDGFLTRESSLGEREQQGHTQ